MKKNFAFLGLIPILCLCACDGDKTSFGLKKSSKSVLSDSLLKENVIDYGSDLREATYSYDSITISSSNLYNSSYLNKGLIIEKNTNSTLTFHSLITGEELYTTNNKSSNVTYNVFSHNYISYILTIVDDTKYVLVDALGNTIYSGYEEYRPSSIYSIDDVYCLDITDGVNTRGYYYTEEGTIETRVDEEEHVYEIGDIYCENTTSLAMIGYPDYQIVTSSNKMSVYKGDKLIGSYTHHPSTLVRGLIETKYFFQIAVELPDDAEKYDVYYSGDKLNTWIETFDLITGKVETLDPNILIGSIDPLRIDNRYSAYAKLTFNEIKDTTIGRTYTYMTDKNLVLYDDLSNLSISSMYRLKEGLYWDSNSGFVYRGNANNVVTRISNGNADYYKESQHFVIENNSKSALASPEGKLLTRFEYDKIYADAYSSTQYVALKDNVYYYMTPNGVETEIGELYSFNQLTNNVYTAIENDTGDRIFFTNRGIVDLNLTGSISYNAIDNILGNKSVVVISENNTSSSTRTYYCIHE